MAHLLGRNNKATASGGGNFTNFLSDIFVIAGIKEEIQA